MHANGRDIDRSGSLWPALEDTHGLVEGVDGIVVLGPHAEVTPIHTTQDHLLACDPAYRTRHPNPPLKHGQPASQIRRRPT